MDLRERKRFAQTIEEMTTRLKELGPNPLAVQWAI